jgi:membrane protein DedA with SNARE-associated domain/rhodanese-related sulfurtransferase
MSKLIELLHTHGALIVFGTVLVEQLGMPIPAMPVLIVAGALAMQGTISWTLCLAVSVLACLISDFFWFGAGRRHGKRVLRLLCRISLSPDYCVSQTEENFRRYGVRSLMVAKFIPGFNTIGPPLAGALGISLPRFAAYALTGGILWSSVGITLGLVFHDSVERVLEGLQTMGSTALAVVLGLLGAFIAYKFVERRRFRRALEGERIRMDELVRLLAEDPPPQLVDTRSPTACELEPGIPGALLYSDALHDSLDRERLVVTYCSCPNDVTAAAVAKRLQAAGFTRVRPLRGGLDAWNAHQRSGPEPELPSMA